MCKKYVELTQAAIIQPFRHQRLLLVSFEFPRRVPVKNDYENKVCWDTSKLVRVSGTSAYEIIHQRMMSVAFQSLNKVEVQKI